MPQMLQNNNTSSRHNHSQHSSVGKANNSQESQGSGHTGMHHASSGSMVLHEAIIDLYLQVKVRSNDEVSNLKNKYYNQNLISQSQFYYN